MTTPKNVTKEWFANFDQHFGLKGDETGQDEAAFIMRVLGLRKGRPVLDIACGAGRVAFHLAQTGCLVTGIDLTRAYINRARKRFAEAGLSGMFIQRDMRTLDFDGQFDAAFNWQGSFGFFSDSENLDVLVRMARAVRPGGRVLIDQPNREYILRHFRTSNRHTTVRSRTRWNRRSQRAETWFVDNATGESWSMSIRLYTVSQFRKLFAAAGLTLVGTCGDLNGGPYSRSSRRIYVVGSRSIHEHPTVLS